MQPLKMRVNLTPQPRLPRSKGLGHKSTRPRGSEGCNSGQEKVLVLVGQMQHDESLSRNGEHMNPHEVVEHPACRRVLDALAFWSGRWPHAPSGPCGYGMARAA